MIPFCAQRVNVPEISDFDPLRYMGTWFEIARLNHHFEQGLEQTTAHYELKADGTIAVTNRGYSPWKHQWEETRAQAVPTAVKNYLKIYFLPLIVGNYRVAYVDPDYTVAVVSGGSLRCLWILARQPTITEQQKETLLHEARKLGYDTSKLIFPAQQWPIL